MRRRWLWRRSLLLLILLVLLLLLVVPLLGLRLGWRRLGWVMARGSMGLVVVSRPSGRPWLRIASW